MKVGRGPPPRHRARATIRRRKRNRAVSAVSVAVLGLVLVAAFVLGLTPARPSLEEIGGLPRYTPPPTLPLPGASPSTTDPPSALPLPAQYLHDATVGQGVDFVAPGGTPLYAVGPGIISREGDVGPDTLVLQLTAGPLAGKAVSYGHTGPGLVPLESVVAAGEQISIVAYGQPGLEIAFWPPGDPGAGQAMVVYLDGAAGFDTSR